jgi:hypothetical protein
MMDITVWNVRNSIIENVKIIVHHVLLDTVTKIVMHAKSPVRVGTLNVVIVVKLFQVVTYASGVVNIVINVIHIKSLKFIYVLTVSIMLRNAGHLVQLNYRELLLDWIVQLVIQLSHMQLP